MPMYVYECPKCGAVCEAMHSVDGRHSQKCKECGCRMDIIVTAAPNHPKEMLRYFDNGLGCYVESRDHRKRLMRERGLREAGDKGEELSTFAREIRERDLDQKHSGR